jgi:hypothetical protein
MIAERLEERWAEAATVPTYPEGGELVEPPPSEAPPPGPGAESSLTTLEELLGDRKRRRPTVRA